MLRTLIVSCILLSKIQNNIIDVIIYIFTQVNMSKFSETLDQKANIPTDIVLELDNILSKIAKIGDEDELEEKVTSLPEKFAPYSGNIDTYLRHRDFIPYSDLHPLQATMMYGLIKKNISAKMHKKYDDFFCAEDGYKCNLADLMSGLARVLSRKKKLPIKTVLAICSLIIYLQKNIVLDDEIEAEKAKAEKAEAEKAEAEKTEAEKTKECSPEPPSEKGELLAETVAELTRLSVEPAVECVSQVIQMESSELTDPSVETTAQITVDVVVHT